MRVVLAIFAIGGLVIAAATAVGWVRDDPAADHSASRGAPTAPAPACRSGEGPTVLTAPPPALADRVDRVWDRIENWLTTRAPGSAAAWNRPATESELISLQRDAGVPLPGELVLSLRRHDGAKAGGFTLPPAYHLMSVHDILATSATLCARGEGWKSGYVPFARDGVGLLHLGGLDQHRVGRPADLVSRLEDAADLLEGVQQGEFMVEVDANGHMRWVRR